MSSSNKAKDSQLSDAILQGMKEGIEELKKTDPLAGVKIGSKEVETRLINYLKDDHGVVIETYLATLGALAGYACQWAIRKELVESGKKAENEAFVIIECTNGKKYYFGDYVNYPLVESQSSVWSYIAGAVQHLNKPLPDLRDIFVTVSKTVGGDQFGILRVPAKNVPKELPETYLQKMWPKIYPLAVEFCDNPFELPILFALAAQGAILSTQEILDTTIAATIAIESAVMMSKVHLLPSSN